MYGYLPMNRKLLLLLICVCCLFASCSTEEVHINVEAKEGIIDLRNIPLAQKQTELGGNWKMYWMQLLKPGEDTGNFELVPMKKMWAELPQNNKKYTATGCATYGLTVLLPPGLRSQLMFQIPDAYSSYRLYINGILFSENGKPGNSKETTIPYWLTSLKTYTPQTDTLHLLMQIANFHHSKGGPYQHIVVGNPAAMSFEKENDRAFDLFLTGCLFMGGFFFLGLFLFGRHDKSMLFFSLFCIFYSYRIIGTKQYALHAIFTHLSWFTAIRLEYIALFMAIAMFVLYTKYLYPKECNHNFLMGLILVCFAFTGITIFSPAMVFTRLINPFLILVLAYVGYLTYVHIIAAKRKRPGAMYAVAGTCTLMIVIVIIIFEYFRIFTLPKIFLFAGYLIFFYLQALILSYRFAYHLNRARILAEQGLKAKSEFMSTMSHEIRTPLNSVIGMTHLLKRDNPRNDQQAHLDVLLFSANNLLNIVNDILDFNKIEAGKISIEQIPMDIVAVARNIIAGYQTTATDKGVHLIIETDPTLDFKVIGDPTRCSQILTNLVHNALKFTNHGWVKLQIAIQEKTEKSVAVNFKVEDTGIGIAPEKQKLIFERFTQADSSTSRSFGGTGLGLSICKTLLELQGSFLHVESVVNQGSSFYFTQHFSIAPLEKTPTDLPIEAYTGNPLSGVQILLVEDNPMNVLVAQNFLTRWGATVEVAENGRIALEKLNVTKHHLILMDLHMPEMDGYEATRQLRSNGITLPIVALTASLPKEVENQVYETGLTDIVVKPFNPDDLLRTILHNI
jgi:signal transduction histidine kinase